MAHLILLIALFFFTQGSEQTNLQQEDQAANQNFQNGQYRGAAAGYQRMIAASPNDPNLRFRAGLALVKAGQPKEAVPHLQRAVALSPAFAPGWFLLGLAYQQLGRPQEALPALGKAVSMDLKNPEYRLEWADAELASGQAANAAFHFKALTAEHPDLLKAWQGLGLSYAVLNQQSFDLCRKSHPDSAYTLALTAQALREEGRFAEALRIAEEAIRRDPTLPQLHAMRAECYRQTGHAEWATVEDEREKHVPPPDCRTHPSACLFARRAYEQVAAKPMAARTPETLYWAARAYRKLAEASFQPISEAPSSPITHEILAEADQKMGRRIEAIQEWRAALALAPEDRRLQGRLAESLARAREYAESEKLLIPLVDNQPQNAEWQYLLGNALFQQGQNERALPHLLAASQLNPSYLPAQELMGKIYLNGGEWQKAVMCLQKALSLDDGSISMGLSTAYRHLGKLNESRTALAQYKKLAGVQKDTPATETAIYPP